MPDGPRRAVLFDVGGPIDREAAFERAVDRAILAALAEEGVVLDSGAFAALCDGAVACFAPNLYEAVIWSALDGDGDRSRRVWSGVLARMASPPPIELRPGITDLIGSLHGRGIRLGLVANQPAAALDRLAAAGLSPFFGHFAVSGTNGFRKPDVRAFLAACDTLGVAPGECVMVGDRIDNDIAPARLLGMAAIRLRTGRHAGQRPRSAREVPDADVDDVAGLAAAVDRLLAGAGGRPGSA